MAVMNLKNLQITASRGLFASSAVSRKKTPTLVRPARGFGSERQNDDTTVD